MALTDKQTVFVREYLVDLSPGGAYVRAGYDVKDETVAGSAGRRMLRNVAVLQAIDAAQCERMERLDLSADWVVTRFRVVYLEALRDRDFSAALRALENIAKHLGLYERDNRQRKLSTEDVEGLKAKLAAAGMNWERTNAPPHLRLNPSGRPPASAN